MKSKSLLTLLLLANAPLMAAELALSVEIPTLNVAEYHRPYAAFWLEKEGGEVAANLAVWYDVEMRADEGKKWLKDMRQWWRRSGRELELPIDGVSSATRAPGQYNLSFTEGQPPLGKLDAGNYVLHVEAAREVGDREVVKIPFTWPPTQAQSVSAQGKSELGALELKITP